MYAKLREHFAGEVTMLLESAIVNERGNYSFILVGAHERVTHKDGKTIYQSGEESLEVDKNPLRFLQKLYAEHDKESTARLAQELGVGFVDGFVGYIGYETMSLFEPVLSDSFSKLYDEAKMPDVDLVRPKLLVAYSHKNSKLTLVSHHDLNTDLEEIRSLLSSSYEYQPLKRATKNGTGRMAMDQESFCAKVEEAKEHIRSGDVFQILISNRFTQDSDVDALSFYRVLRAKNPSPYMYLLEFEDFAIAGSSPEAMVQLHGRQVSIRPIAGTRKRGKTHAKDKEMEAELLSDPKERSEHIMLVDLARNDIGRVCIPGSIKVEELMRVERYSHVMHMVSDVVGELEESKDMFDLFMATFTAGTMTGAPKIKAMELIAQFEGTKRGFYSGAIGYFGLDGNMDSAIAIRTSLIKDGSITFQAGAGVVADSVPALENLEVQNKMAANIASFEDLLQV